MKFILSFIVFAKIDLLVPRVLNLLAQGKALRIGNATNQKLNFIPQGSFDFEIMGPLNKFKIAPTSHIKSGTYIECSGGVKIGNNVHIGRGLTIFSSNHNWRSTEYLPYDSKDILKPVVIGDAVWIGANVTILPGVIIGDAAVIAAGSVVAHDVDFGAVVGGNPAKVIARRDKELTKRLLAGNKLI
ncbi:MAG TPA: acyltransferase [Colwellia sp.]|nr:acyltransferase [Colwellia sp.]|tara:strand:+ start:4662 stop:5219 length:558 start_codon:yes stop_codon:yes gene_type:complete